MCTVFVAPDASVGKSHVKSVLLLLNEQPPDCEAIDQLMPVPVGSGSSMCTFVAVPGPALCTVIVKPICEPALTDDASAVFVSVRFGHCTVVDACAWIGVGSFVAEAVAVLMYCLQLANAVPLVMC